jgi:signal transduction histidine kinase
VRTHAKRTSGAARVTRPAYPEEAATFEHWVADLSTNFIKQEAFTHALARKRAQEALDMALGFERLATNILSSLLLAEMQNEAEVVEQGLGEIARFLQVQRVTLLERLPGTMAFRNVHRWRAPDVPPAPMQFGIAELPWVSARLASNEIVSFTRLDELPEAAEADRKTLQSLGACSQLVVPHCHNGNVIGALAIAAVYQERTWPLALIPGLRLLAGVFSSLSVRRASEAQKCAAEFEAAQWRERLAHLVRVHTAGELSCALAHEFTQPLGAIENYAMAARRRLGGPAPDLAKIGALLDNIVGQASRAGDLISRLRTMVKRHDLVPSRISLKRLIGDCVAMVKMECELRGIVVRQLVAANLPFVVVDEIHIQQVILNLLRNAMEAMEQVPEDADKVMTLRVGLCDSGCVSVSVADSGTGIAQGELEQVFESFFSNKPSGWRSAAGSWKPMGASSGPRTARKAAPCSSSPCP